MIIKIAGIYSHGENKNKKCKCLEIDADSYNEAVKKAENQGVEALLLETLDNHEIKPEFTNDYSEEILCSQFIYHAPWDEVVKTVKRMSDKNFWNTFKMRQLDNKYQIHI
jgi:ribonuclease HIII